MSDDPAPSATTAASPGPAPGVTAQAAPAPGPTQSGDPPALSPDQQRQAILTDQHGAIIADFSNEICEIACNDRDFMNTRGTGASKEFFRSGKVVQVPNRSLDDAFVFLKSNGHPELWARPDYSDYDGLFDIVSRQYYGVAWSSIASGQDWNVDHMYPHTAAELSQVKYVRLTPIDAKANTSMGRNIEKQMARRAREINAGNEPGQVPLAGRRPVLTATFFTLGKLTGFHDAIKLPQDRNDFADQSVIDRLDAHVSTRCRFVEPACMSRLNAVLTGRSATVIQTPLGKKLEKLTRFDTAHAATLRGGR